MGAMQAWSLQCRRQGRLVGLVPTMGCLHDGHMSLVRLARCRAEAVVVSIFVNPTQFLPGEDFEKYPRDYDGDTALCRSAGVDVVFFPAACEMYAKDHSVSVDEQNLSRGLCGSSRPGHFRGVLTVVAKLFNAVLPDVAVFGQKDAQQARLIARMVRDLNFPLEVVVGPIIREPDGLAMSSRNKYLSPVERQDALCLRRALDRVEALFRGGERAAAGLRAGMMEVFSSTPSARVDYAEIVDDETLEPLQKVERKALVVLAVRVGKTRLLDNTLLAM